MPELLVMIASGRSIQVEYMLSGKKYWRKIFSSSPCPQKKSDLIARGFYRWSAFLESFIFKWTSLSTPSLMFKPTMSVLFGCFSYQTPRCSGGQEQGRKKTQSYTFYFPWTPLQGFAMVCFLCLEGFSLARGFLPRHFCVKLRRKWPIRSWVPITINTLHIMEVTARLLE